MSCGCAKCETESLAPKQPKPKGTGAVILPLVLRDLEERAEIGKANYGEYLRANNGRSALLDAYEEAMDLTMYLRQLIEEQK